MKKQIMLMSVLLVLMVGVSGNLFSLDLDWNQINANTQVSAIDAFVKNIVVFNEGDRYQIRFDISTATAVSYTHLRAHET